MFLWKLASLANIILSGSIVAAFNGSGKDNVAVYWGQNSAQTQQRLSYYCDSNSVDIIILSFVTVFPGKDNIPSLNFANACSEQYSNGLLHCSQIAADIKTCQSKNKKVLLSLGGASGLYSFSSDSEAQTFAGSLWNLFGEGKSDTRPFDDAVIDGFDLDIENNIPTGYAALVTKLRTYFAKGSKQYYISAAPQCPIPDASLNNVLTNADVDFAFIQFYNNYCNIGANFNWNDWVNWANSDAHNKNIRLYLGLPGNTGAAGSGYTDVSRVKSTIDSIYSGNHFGGIAIWDASQAFANKLSSGNYAEAMKSILLGKSGSPTSSSSSSTARPTTTSTTTSKTSSKTSSTTSHPTTPSKSTSKTSTSSRTTSSTSRTTSSTSSKISTTSKPTISTPKTTKPSTFKTTARTSFSSLITTTYHSTITRPSTTLTSTVRTTISASTSAHTTSKGPSAPCNNGDFKCDNGAIAKCDHGAWVVFQCAQGTRCYSYTFNGVPVIGCNFIS